MSVFDKKYHLDLDMRQLSYLYAIVESDFKKCSSCNRRWCGLTKEQCDSYKKVKKELLDILKSF